MSVRLFHCAGYQSCGLSLNAGVSKELEIAAALTIASPWIRYSWRCPLLVVVSAVAGCWLIVAAFDILPHYSQKKDSVVEEPWTAAALRMLQSIPALNTS